MRCIVAAAAPRLAHCDAVMLAHFSTSTALDAVKRCRNQGIVLYVGPRNWQKMGDMANTVPWALSHTQIAVEVVATIAFALSGVIEGARKHLDAVGICVVAGLAAFGGGTVRDILLDRRPLFWVQHASWVWALLALCIGAMFFMRARHLEPTERAMQWPDALGLGLFTAGGAQIAIDAGMPAVICVVLGVVTAVFGGVLRDVVCNEIPRAFSDHRPYAICSFLGGWVMVLAHAAGLPQWGALFAAAGTATALRAAALAMDWRLPAWQAGAPLRNEADDHRRR